jgi:hypothetical protein
MRPNEMAKREGEMIAIKVGVTFVFAVIAGAIMTVLHIPSGH